MKNLQSKLKIKDGKLLVPVGYSSVTTGKYVCRDCNGNFTVHHTEDRAWNEIRCNTDGCKSTGIISRQTVETRQTHQALDEAEIKKNYPDIFPPKEKKSAEESIKELGYG